MAAGDMEIYVRAPFFLDEWITISLLPGIMYAHEFDLAKNPAISESPNGAVIT